jgi:hypothetical protein
MALADSAVAARAWMSWRRVVMAFLRNPLLMEWKE